MLAEVTMLRRCNGTNLAVPCPMEGKAVPHLLPYNGTIVLPCTRSPPPPCPANKKALKTYGPNGSVRWTRRSVPT